MVAEDFLWIGIAIPTGLALGVVGLLGFLAWRWYVKGHR